ncbi:hypothetical protein A2U01_0001383 [Trifolium medium]|uniref:Uncharacterized protein n=1 Tax=Trifolium medium TaxID=97028 RepID=A0A392M039_9FABA|nr:hypothetical protein [Trifolium medium]
MFRSKESPSRSKSPAPPSSSKSTTPPSSSNLSAAFASPTTFAVKIRSPTRKTTARVVI